MRAVFLIIFIFLLSNCTRPFKKPPTYYPSKRIPSWLKPYTINGKTYYPLPSAKGYKEICYASWYGPKFHGKRSASGEIYNMHDFTAAHRILPIGTYVLVKNLENGKEVVVRINDRGPFVENRCIDLSYAAAKKLGFVKKGIAKVKIIALSEGKIIDNGIVYKHIPNIRFRKFYLQVGAFKYYQNALKLRSKLKKEFKEVKIEPVKRGKTVFYRVQIYLSNNLSEALKLAEKLKKERFKTAFLVGE